MHMTADFLALNEKEAITVVTVTQGGDLLQTPGLSNNIQARGRGNIDIDNNPLLEIWYSSTVAPFYPCTRQSDIGWNRSHLR